MSYAANPWFTPPDWTTGCLPMKEQTFDRLYHVSAKRYVDGHTCLSLTWLDRVTSRVISEKIGCVELAADTRSEMLRAVVHGAVTALRDSEAGVE